eukprot:1158842-Pelagomonas_calceolata.AAC.9
MLHQRGGAHYKAHVGAARIMPALSLQFQHRSCGVHWCWALNIAPAWRGTLQGTRCGGPRLISLEPAISSSFMWRPLKLCAQCCTSMEGHTTRHTLGQPASCRP